MIEIPSALITLGWTNTPLKYVQPQNLQKAASPGFPKVFKREKSPKSQFFYTSYFLKLLSFIVDRKHRIQFVVGSNYSPPSLRDLFPKKVFIHCKPLSFKSHGNKISMISNYKLTRIPLFHTCSITYQITRHGRTIFLPLRETIEESAKRRHLWQ